MNDWITKRCPACDEVKSIDEFYRQGARIHPNCKKCENARPRVRPASKTVAQRARHRAVAELISRHETEFEALKLLFKVEVEREMAELAEAMPERVDPETKVVPLKPGQRMEGETVADRVADPCEDCERHHTRGHKCPVCGAKPGEDTVVVNGRKVKGVEARSLKVPAKWVG